MTKREYCYVIRSDGWISVKDRLPEEGIQVLAYGQHHQRNEPCYFAAMYSGDIWGFSIPRIGGLNVTHWQPLPSPPKTTQHENI